MAEHSTTSLTTLPPITSIPSLSTTTRAQILDLLFEPSPQLHTLSLPLLHETPFHSYTTLISAVEHQLRNLQKSSLKSDRDWLDRILEAHPRLGEKKQGGGGGEGGEGRELSEASRREQEAMEKASAEENGEGSALQTAEKLRKLNEEYEKTFEGLKYVTFVNGRPRPIIMEDMERRIKRGDIEQEKSDAIEAMCDIAIDRAKKMGGS